MDFDEFYAGSYVRLLSGLALLCASRAEAEDVLAHSYLSAWQGWSKVSRLDKPEAWVRRVAVNRATDLHRERSRSTRMLRRLWTRPTVEEPSAQRTDLVRAMARLSDRQRTALVLHHVLDLSVEEVAAETRMPVGSVKSHLSRGRARLAVLLSEAREDQESSCV